MPGGVATLNTSGVIPTSQLPASIPGGVKIANGNYVGTGTCGASNPTRITISGFVPKLVIIQGSMHNSNDYGHIVCVRDAPRSYTVSGGVVVFWGPDYMQFYTTNGSPIYQANAAGDTYHYMAIG